jgi:hypothetical protein
MITARAALEQTSANMLGFYLANNQNNVLVVVKNYIPGQTQNAIRGPNGAGSVHMRLEVETKTLWIEQREMRAWFIRNGLDIERAMAELEQENIIVSTNRKITLSAGVVGYATGQTPVYEVDLAHPAVASELRSLDSGRESIGRMVR